MNLCLDLLAAGLPFEHWCNLPEGHSGDHHCGDCGDVWNPSDEHQEPETHWEFRGSCPMCTAEQMLDSTL